MTTTDRGMADFGPLSQEEIDAPAKWAEEHPELAEYWEGES